MEIKNITVLGSGIMGHGISQVSAMAGYNVVLRDIEQKFLDKAIEKIKWSLDKLVSKEKITDDDRNKIISRIIPMVDLNEAVQNTEDYVREIVTIFFVQLKTIFLVTIIISLCAVYVAYFWPPTYAVYGTVLLKAKKLEKSLESLEQTQIKHFELTKEDLSSDMEMMTSPDLIRSTLLAMSEEGTYYPEMKNSQDQISRTINSLKSQFTTELLPNSNIIKLTFSDRLLLKQ